ARASFGPGRLTQARFEPRLAEHVDAAGVLVQPVGAEPQLVGRLFARDVQRAHALALEPRGALHQQRGFADAGLAADEGDGAWDDAPAEDEVEFRQSGPPALDGLLLQVR